MSNIVKSKFAGLLRGLLRRFDDSDARTAAPPRPVAAAAPARATPPAAAPQFRPQPVHAPPAASLGNLQLPLSSIMPVLPMDLRAKLLMQTPPAGASVSIPVEKALSQLAHGSVKISFGELCAALPGLFDHSGENDARQIVLPLNEIISRINPALLSRRAAKKIEVTDDIASPFSARTPGAGFVPAQTPAKAAPTTTPKAPAPARAAPTPNPVAPPAAIIPKANGVRDQARAGCCRPAHDSSIFVRSRHDCCQPWQSAIAVVIHHPCPADGFARKTADANAARRRVRFHPRGKGPFATRPRLGQNFLRRTLRRPPRIV